jgi:hypothetical protein
MCLSRSIAVDIDFVCVCVCMYTHDEISTVFVGLPLKCLAWLTYLRDIHTVNFTSDGFLKIFVSSLFWSHSEWHGISIGTHELKYRNVALKEIINKHWRCFHIGMVLVRFPRTTRPCVHGIVRYPYAMSGNDENSELKYWVKTMITRVYVYVCVYIYVCFMHVCMYLCMYVCVYICMYVRNVYVCMYVCTYVCM